MLTVACVRCREQWSQTPDTWAEKFESFERINSIRETNGNFDWCNSCKRLGTSRLHELHESKISVCFTYRIYPFETFEFFCSCIRGHSVVCPPSGVCAWVDWCPTPLVAQNGEWLLVCRRIGAVSSFVAVRWRKCDYSAPFVSAKEKLGTDLSHWTMKLVPSPSGL